MNSCGAAVKLCAMHNHIAWYRERFGISAAEYTLVIGSYKSNNNNNNHNLCIQSLNLAIDNNTIQQTSSQ